MAIKESIVQRRDACIDSIKASENFLEEQKQHYIEMVCNAAEGTNGLNQQDKLQNVSESSFERTTMMIGVEEKLLVLENKLENNKTAIDSIKEELKDNTKQLKTNISQISNSIDGLSSQIKTLVSQKTSCDQKFAQIASQINQAKTHPQQNNIENLSWKNIIKLVLVKPWIWITISLISFSPKCLEILHIIIDKFS